MSASLTPMGGELKALIETNEKLHKKVQELQSKIRKLEAEISEMKKSCSN